MATKTLLSAATSDARSKTVAYGGTGAGGEICLTVRGTLGAGSGSVDISHDGTNWIPSGATLDSTTQSVIVSLRPGMKASVDYTADASSPGASSWTVEAS